MTVVGSCCERQLFRPTERITWVTVCMVGSFFKMAVIW